MRYALRLILVYFAAALIAGCRTPDPFGPERRLELAKSISDKWSSFSSVKAESLLEQYGAPDAIAPGALAWKQAGRWKRIVLWDANRAYIKREKTADNLEQTVSSRVPESKRAALASFGARVQVSEDGREMSALSSCEDFNVLALNLADEIARGVRTPVQARRFYDRTIQTALAGKSSPYLRKLLFKYGPWN